MPQCSFELSNTLTILLALLGWFVVSRQNNLAESRKELRSAIDVIVHEIDELRDLALKYYSSKFEDSFEMAFRVKVNQARLINKIERLSKTNKSFEKLTHLEELMDAVSGGDFENYNRPVRLYSKIPDEILLNIAYCSDNLIQAIELAFISECKSVKFFKLS